ncbi:MAG: hypothetical protein LBI72_11870 [Flavobacteriaceae bacterium]|jgi:hypothetical protein|nr:hypothetical protein [Flavobacteriaceae bacterium]
MWLFYFLGIVSFVCASCGSTDKLVESNKDYKREYKVSVATYNETVDSQIYYNGNENISIMKQDGKVLKSIRTVPQQ